MRRLQTFPVSFKVRDRKILIIGNGLEAVAKARLAARTSAELHIFTATPMLEFGATLGTSANRPLTESDLDGVALIFIAGDYLNSDEVKVWAKARGIPVNVVDKPDECDFFTPAIVDRAPVTVAISSEGDSPVLARLVRARIEALLPLHLGKLATLAGSLRERVFAALGHGAPRRHYFEALALSGAVEKALDAEDDARAAKEAERLLERHAREDAQEGFVWLIGAGPGAEDLLTLRAQRLLQQADVILHDALVPQEVVEMGRRDATRISVGKRKGRHTITQAEINSTLIVEARRGRRIVRLKGGDPMIFGRAGEEISALRRAGIGYAIVPGVTAALAAAAETATPLTLRGVSSGVIFATAHGAKDEELHHWAALAAAGLTLGIYMGKSVAGRVSAKLMEAGMDAALPVGIAVNAGRGGKHFYRGTLSELGGNHAAFANGPALILIGKAVEAGDWENAATLAPAEAELVA